MSNSRPHRRRLAGAKVASILAEADASTPTYVGPAPGGGEIWRAGPVALVVAGIPFGAPPELAQAMARRRDASLTGRCQCGGRPHLLRASHTGSIMAVVHREDCPATDEAVVEALEAWRQVG